MEFSEIGASVARLSAVIGVGRLAAFVVLPAALRTVSGGQASSDDRASSSDNLWSVFFHSYVTYLAVLGAWELGATPQERWTSQSDASATAGLLICADNLMQLPVQFRKKVPLSKTWTVLAHHVAQTGVQSLACDRVHPARSVTNERKPVGHKPRCQHQIERIGVARAVERNLAKKISKPWLQDLEVFVIVERLNCIRLSSVFGPYDGRAVARQGQDRQWAGRHEELMRCPVMRKVVADGANHG